MLRQKAGLGKNLNAAGTCHPKAHNISLEAVTGSGVVVVGVVYEQASLESGG